MWATAADFEFELPGDGWVEESMQSFAAQDARISQFVTRTALPEEGVAPVLGLWRAKMTDDADEQEVVGEGPTNIGDAHGQEVRLLVRQQGAAHYCRLISVEYYELALTFCWVGPANETRHIDEHAEECIRSTRFRER